VQDRDNDIYYVDDPRALPSLLKDGDFAEPIPVDRIPDNLYASLFSGAVTELWNQEQAIVVKIPSNESTLSTPPCEDDSLFAYQSYCDDDGNRYVLLKYPELGSWLDVPWSDETKDAFKDLPGYDSLEDYGLSIESVARGTEHAYYRNGEASGMDWNPETTAEFLMEETNNMIQFVTFNFPYCDLAGDPDSFGYSTEFEKVEDGDCDAECQILYRITTGCYSFFSWDHTEIVNWEDSCDWIPGHCENVCIPGGFAGSGDCGDD
jgi:hypothetical protein